MVEKLNLLVALTMYSAGTIVFIIGRRIGEKEDGSKKIRLSFFLSLLSLFIFCLSYIGSTAADLGFGGIVLPFLWLPSIILLIIGVIFDRKVKQETVYNGTIQTNTTRTSVSFKSGIVIFILGLAILFLPSFVKPGTMLSLFTVFLWPLAYILMFTAAISTIIKVFKK